MKIIKPTLAVASLFLAMTLSGCTFNTPLQTYSDAVAKTKALTAVKETSALSISTEMGDKKSNTEISMDVDTDYGQNLSTGIMQVVAGETTAKYPMYIKDDMTYLYMADADKYMKTPSHGSLLSNNAAQEYADKFAKMMETDKFLQNITVTEDSNKEQRTQTITFTIPSAKTKEMIESMLTDSVVNEEVKQQAVDQTVSKLKEAKKGQDITEAEIKKIVYKKAAVLDNKLQETFKNLEFSDIIYTVTIDKDGIIKHQVFTMTIKNISTGQIMAFEMSHTIREYNGQYVVTMPDIDNTKIVDTSSLNNLILGNMQS